MEALNFLFLLLQDVARSSIESQIGHWLYVIYDWGTKVSATASLALAAFFKYEPTIHGLLSTWFPPESNIWKWYGRILTTFRYLSASPRRNEQFSDTLISVGQYETLRAMADERGLNLEEETIKANQKPVKELTKREASALIIQFKGLKRVKKLSPAQKELIQSLVAKNKEDLRKLLSKTFATENIDDLDSTQASLLISTLIDKANVKASDAVNASEMTTQPMGDE